MVFVYQRAAQAASLPAFLPSSRYRIEKKRPLALSRFVPTFKGMETRTVIRENWLTKPRYRHAGELTAGLLGLLFLGSFIYLMDVFGAQAWMDASPETVFADHQYWRAWTTLLAHGDLGHVLANSFLFVPFSYFLARHFGLVFFPLAGIFFAGITNLLVLKTMPPTTSLVGASGLVYWMGAAWLTLFWLIDKRDKTARRLGKVFMVGGVIFVPDVLRPNVSHMAHYVGFLFGVLSGVLAFAWNREKIEAAEVRELVVIPEPEWNEEWQKLPDLPKAQ